MFRVGQKVVCVDDEPSNLGGSRRAAPIKGHIYTVSAVGLTNILDPQQLPCILVEELERHPYEAHWATRFRPITERKTDISFAHEILRKATKQADTDIGASA